VNAASSPPRSSSINSPSEYDIVISRQSTIVYRIQQLYKQFSIEELKKQYSLAYL
jgi:hypothetical protein